MTTSRKGIGGPKTPEGKKRSSLNSLKHGLSARSPQAIQAIAQQLNIDFEGILEEIRAHYRPRDPVEEQLVKRIARCMWRLTLSETMEQRIIGLRGVENRPGFSYERILKYERLVDIHLHRALLALARHRATGAAAKLPEGSDR